MGKLGNAIAGPALVTGATGFIGQRLCQRLVDEGVEVRAFILPRDAVPQHGFEAIDVARGDVTDRISVSKAMQGCGTVFHLAAMVGDWGGYELHQRVTVKGTEHVLGEAARKQVRAILASSVVVYGDRIGRDVCDETHAFGKFLGAYSKSKQEQERIALRLEASQSLQVTIVRPTNVYGPASGPWLHSVVEQLKAGAPCLIDGGDRVAGLTYVDNVVDVLVRAAATRAAVGRVYNANDDHGVTWKRYFNDLAQIVGTEPPKSINSRVAKIAAVGLETGFRLLRKKERPMITREALNLVASNHRVPIKRARRDLGYEPSVGYEQAMQNIADYLAASSS